MCQVSFQRSRGLEIGGAGSKGKIIPPANPGLRAEAGPILGQQLTHKLKKFNAPKLEKQNYVAPNRGKIGAGGVKFIVSRLGGGQVTGPVAGMRGTLKQEPQVSCAHFTFSAVFRCPPAETVALFLQACCERKVCEVGRLRLDRLRSGLCEGKQAPGNGKIQVERYWAHDHEPTLCEVDQTCNKFHGNIEWALSEICCALLAMC